jgi:hypothetical protein
MQPLAPARSRIHCFRCAAVDAELENAAVVDRRQEEANGRALKGVAEFGARRGCHERRDVRESRARAALCGLRTNFAVASGAPTRTSNRAASRQTAESTLPKAGSAHAANCVSSRMRHKDTARSKASWVASVCPASGVPIKALRTGSASVFSPCLARAMAPYARRIGSRSTSTLGRH